MSFFPTDPKKIRARIRSYERKLQKELEETGMIHDGYGKRYLLGPLYLLMNDVEGALNHYAWFEETCPDDGGDPIHLLCWALVYYRVGRLDAGVSKLRQAMLSNLLLIPQLLGLPEDDIGLGDEALFSEKFYLEYAPGEVFTLWDEAALNWLIDVYQSPEVKVVRERYIALEKQLATEPPGPRRTQLVKEAVTMRYEV
jgi:tetratricopeptide (TPR) repeat protein